MDDVHCDELQLLTLLSFIRLPSLVIFIFNQKKLMRYANMNINIYIYIYIIVVEHK